MTYSLPQFIPGPFTKRFEIVIRGVVKAHVQLQQFDQLRGYTERAYKYLYLTPNYEEYLAEMLRILDEEYPPEADRLRKLILVS